MEVKAKNKTQNMVYIALFVVVMAVCAWIVIPMAVPFTLQTFAVFLAVGVLGGKRGSLVVLLYLLLGSIGIPVFSGFTGGIGILLGNTGGYLIGFLLMTLVMWGMESLFGRKNRVLFLSMVLGLFVCYAFGTIWFLFVYGRNTGTVGITAVLGFCVFPFIIPDFVKMALAMLVRKRLMRTIKID